MGPAGAIVTGVDFSPKAIALARSLATEAGIEARFVESNIYDLPEALSGRFDVVFCSDGVLCWLPDLKRWGEIVASYLEPGGTFYIAEAHPFIRVFPMDNDITRTARPSFARTSRTSTTRPARAGSPMPTTPTRRPDTRRPSTRGSTAWAIS